jgi:hypothetical protein
VKREGSLSLSEQPPLYSYPEPHESSRCPSTHFLKTYWNIILPSIPRSLKCSFCLRFSHRNSVCTYPRPLHATSPDHLIILNLIIRIIFGKEYRSQCSSLSNLIHSQVGGTASNMEGSCECVNKQWRVADKRCFSTSGVGRYTNSSSPWNRIVSRTINRWKDMWSTMRFWNVHLNK